MKKTPVIISIVAALGLIYVAIYGFGVPQGGGGSEPAPEAVAVENGVQVITVTAKGGYSPRSVSAQANMPSAAMTSQPQVNRHHGNHGVLPTAAMRPRCSSVSPTSA